MAQRMILQLDRGQRSYSCRGEPVICIRGAAKLGWPETETLMLEVANTETLGFTQVLIAYASDDDYRIDVDGALFYAAYEFLLELLDEQEVHYRLING